MEFNRNLSQVAPSLTLVLAAKVKELKKQGVDIVGFTVGEPDFPTPSYIKSAGIGAIENNFTRYTEGIGIPELRQAVVDKLKRDHGVSYNTSNIAVSNGAKHSISNVLFALLNPGDEVVIPTPYWLSYPAMVLLCSGQPVYVPTTRDNGYKVTAADLEAKITEKTKVVFLNSPNNPTGSVYSKEELKSLVSVIKKTGVWVIADEIYEKLIYGEEKFTSLSEFSEIKDQVILVNGVSKAYAMTGWRIGYIAAREDLIKAVNKIQSQFTSSPCSISQKAAIAALQEEGEEVKAMRKAFAQRRKLALSLFARIPGLEVYPSEGAFYLFPQCNAYYGKSFNGKKIENSLDLAEYFLNECHVAVVPGSVFGCDENFRISYAISEEEIEKGLLRLQEGLAKLV